MGGSEREGMLIGWNVSADCEVQGQSLLNDKVYGRTRTSNMFARRGGREPAMFAGNRLRPNSSGHLYLGTVVHPFQLLL